MPPPRRRILRLHCHKARMPGVEKKSGVLYAKYPHIIPTPAKPCPKAGSNRLPPGSKEQKFGEHASFASVSLNIPRAEESVQPGNLAMIAIKNTILNCTAILRRKTPPLLPGAEIALPTTTATKPPDNHQDRPRTNFHSPILIKLRVCLTIRAPRKHRSGMIGFAPFAWRNNKPSITIPATVTT